MTNKLLKSTLRISTSLLVILSSCRNEVGNKSTAEFLDKSFPINRLHSHNDYEANRPLDDALEKGFRSIEIDVRMRSGRVAVSHFPFSKSYDAESVYLIPLSQWIGENQSKEPFLLWIDLKENSETLIESLHELLATRGFFESPLKEHVTLVMTGNEEAKIKFLESYQYPNLLRDSNRFDPNASATETWQWLALDWTRHIGWNGRSPISSGQQKKLDDLLATAKKNGFSIRFWNHPSSELFWKYVHTKPIDLVNGDFFRDSNPSK